MYFCVPKSFYINQLRDMANQPLNLGRLLEPICGEGFAPAIEEFEEPESLLMGHVLDDLWQSPSETLDVTDILMSAWDLGHDGAWEILEEILRHGDAPEQVAT